MYWDPEDKVSRAETALLWVLAALAVVGAVSVVRNLWQLVRWVLR